MDTRSRALTLNGHAVKLYFAQPDDRRLYPVAYVSGTKPDMDMPAYSTIGVDPENDAAWRRYNRAEIKQQRLLLEEVLPGLQHLLGYTAPIKAAFSRKAGCSCSCSPGFKLDRPVYLDGRRVVGIYVTK